MCNIGASVPKMLNNDLIIVINYPICISGYVQCILMTVVGQYSALEKLGRDNPGANTFNNHFCCSD